jgi:UDP-N-acetylmuramate-alanine ligase
MLGKFQAENITGCFAMAHSIGIAPEKIIKRIAEFKGMKRRLEKRYEGTVTILDDIAHSPEKASSTLKNIREIYTGKITVVFEPNIGGRERASAYKYDNSFKDADEVIIPRLTKLKIGDDMPMEGKELADTIAKTHPNVKYIENDEELVNNLKGDVIAFLGSHGFRGMIEATISLRQQSQ